jgi:regulator of extracellular matrix RemA (YlzA/DUF370 family)
MLSIGHENYVQSKSVVSILKPDSAPMKKLRLRADEQRMLINATNGRKTRSIIVMKSNHVVLSSIQPRVLTTRMEDLQKSIEV